MVVVRRVLMGSRMGRELIRELIWVVDETGSKLVGAVKVSWGTEDGTGWYSLGADRGTERCSGCGYTGYMWMMNG